MSETEKQTEEILSYARSLGATLAGVADISLLKDLPVHGGFSLAKFKYAISIAIVLPSEAVEMITIEDPGSLYAHAYKTTNEALDSIAIKVAAEICRRGYRAIVIPASMRVDQASQVAHAPHKAFAWAAGLGWIGRNAMLTTPQFGSRVRLVTVLTDIPLIPGKPIPNKCGVCRLCVLACPAKAFTYVPFEVRPSSREEIFDPQKCYTKLLSNKKVLTEKHHMGEHAVHICGICIKVCPYGKTAPHQSDVSMR